MTLWFPWIVGVTVRDSGGNVLDGVTVRVRDLTKDQGMATSVTDVNGKCIINIQNYSSDGDTISVFCSNGSEYGDVSFILNVFAPSMIIDLDLEEGVFGLPPGAMAEIMVGGCC